MCTDVPAHTTKA